MSGYTKAVRLLSPDNIRAIVRAIRGGVDVSAPVEPDESLVEVIEESFDSVEDVPEPWKIAFDTAVNN
ncbi:MAG: hypothetical protein SXQ77_08375, partial [Halobacteria archaeon]|nr:hypothetical protein [Halobacteria archaeon]